MIKKILKVSFMNLILCIFVLLFFEFLLYTVSYIKTEQIISIRNLNNEEQQIHFSSFFKNMKIFYIDSQYYSIDEFRIPAIKNSVKAPIVMLGCSFTFGDGLSEEDAPHQVLSSFSNRTIYNLALGGRSPRDMLYILRQDNHLALLLNNEKTVDYFIYTFIPDHTRRLYFDLVSFSPSPKFVLKTRKDKKNFLRNNDSYLVHKKRNILDRSYLYRLISEYYLYFILDVLHKSDSSFDLFCLYMKEINREIKNKFKNAEGDKSKLIILLYDDIYIDYNWEQLRKEGILVYSLPQLVDVNLEDQKYKLPDGHPNRDAWNIICPKVAEKLNL